MLAAAFVRACLSTMFAYLFVWLVGLLSACFDVVAAMAAVAALFAFNLWVLRISFVNSLYRYYVSHDCRCAWRSIWHEDCEAPLSK